MCVCVCVCVTQLIDSVCVHTCTCVCVYIAANWTVLLFYHMQVISQLTFIIKCSCESIIISNIHCKFIVLLLFNILHGIFVHG